MDIITGIFIGMGLYAFATGAWFAGLIALILANLVYWAKHVLNDVPTVGCDQPKSIDMVPDTTQLLNSQDCECMCRYTDPNFSNQIPKPDSEI